MTQTRTFDLPGGSYSTSRPALRRYGPPAEFLSQVLSQRHHLTPGPVRSSQSIAADTYAGTARSAIRRMPAGYRKTVVV